MKFEKIDEARKYPEKVTELELGLNSTKKKYGDPDFDESEISDLIGDLSIYKNLEILKLAAFPVSDKLLSSIRGNKKIKSLTLHNIGIIELPEVIRELPDLEELNIIDNSIKTLPAWIGELKKLRILNLYGCNKLTALPKEILFLTNLKELILGENYKLKKFPEKIENFITGLDKESQKQIKAILKKIEKSKEKKNKKDEFGQFISKFENKPCIIYFEGKDHNAIVFDWKTFDDDEIKDFLNDELGDEMFDNKGFVPFAILTHPKLNIKFSNYREFFENEKIVHDIYLMINRKNKKLFQSGYGKIDISIEDLKIRLKK